MRAQLATLVALCLVVALPATAQSSSAAKTFSGPKHHVPGRALLKLSDRTVDVAEALTALGRRKKIELRLVRTLVLGWLLVDVGTDSNVPDEGATEAIVAGLAGDPALDHAELETWARPLAFAINDPFSNQMWPLDVANIRNAWDDERGLTTQRIGVVDTGVIRAHEDLAGRIATGFDFISTSPSNFANDGDGRDAEFNDPGDGCNGGASSFHGTHVAGTLAATANNSIGTAGVNHNAKLVVVRALGKCGGSSVDIMEGALWAAGGSVAGVTDIGTNRVSVVNMSLGTAESRCSAFEQQVIDSISGLGTVVVAATGNNGLNINSPANCANVLSVGAHLRSRAKAAYTATGTTFGGSITLYGPGGLIAPVVEDGVISTLGPRVNDYGFFQGTSMATPHVAGVVSLMLAKDRTLSRAQIVSKLLASGGSCTGCDGKVAVDAAAALALVVRGGEPVGTDDSFEENDSIGAAKRLRCGETHNLFAAPAEQDWYFVDVAPGPLTATMTGGTADIDLFIYRNVDQLAQSRQANSDENVTFNAVVGERLLILVEPFNDVPNAIAHTGAYTLSVACTPQATPTEGEGEGEGEGPVGEGEGEGEVPVGEGEGEGPVGEGEGEDLILPTAGGTCGQTSTSTTGPLVLLGLALMRRRRQR